MNLYFLSVRPRNQTVDVSMSPHRRHNVDDDDVDDDVCVIYIYLQSYRNAALCIVHVVCSMIYALYPRIRLVHMYVGRYCD